jgi:hypothetical protein
MAMNEGVCSDEKVVKSMVEYLRYSSHNKKLQIVTVN